MTPTLSSERSILYDPGDFWDEALDARGSPRPEYELPLATVAELGTDELARRVGKAVARLGATFGAGGAQSFPVDPIPRLISSAEWRWLEAALAQRALALNGLIADGYGDHRT